MSTKVMSGIVAYPVYVDIEIDVNATEEQIGESLLEEADKVFDTSTIKPIVVDYHEKQKQEEEAVDN